MATQYDDLDQEYLDSLGDGGDPPAINELYDPNATSTTNFEADPPETNTGGTTNPSPTGGTGYDWRTDWRWNLGAGHTLPPPRPGYKWEWRGGFQENGQGWQEIPIGGSQPIDPNVIAQANTTTDTNEYGLNYWEAKGYGADKIFDLSTGQLKPGWIRTARGYENPTLQAQLNTNNNNNNNSNNQFGTYQGGTPPPFVKSNSNFGSGVYGPGAPAFHGPTWTPPPNFAYNKTFTAPTEADVLNDPSYEFRLDQGSRALENSAAAKGLLASGGTLKDLIDYGQNFASQEYGNIYQHKWDEYKFDFDKEFDTWTANYGLSKDKYSADYKLAYDTYQPTFTEWQTNTNNAARAQELLFNSEWQMYESALDRAIRERELNKQDT